MSFAIRLLTPLVHPTGLIWILVGVTAGLCAWRKRWLGTGVAGAAFVALWILGQPRLTLPVYQALELPWTEFTLEHAPAADAVVVLGGGWRTSLHDYRQIDLNESADRLVTGVELCRQGKAPVLVLGGDPLRPAPGLTDDSARVRLMARAWGLQETEVLSLGPVGTTADEAGRTQALIRQRGWKRILVVTSAFHMRRAAATFRKAGIECHPVACDFRYAGAATSTLPWRFVPGDETLGQLTVWWHEQLGWYAYRLLGRI